MQAARPERQLRPGQKAGGLTTLRFLFLFLTKHRDEADNLAELRFKHSRARKRTL
jgi:hypothetical protein